MAFEGNVIVSVDEGEQSRLRDSMGTIDTVDTDDSEYGSSVIS